MVAFARCWCALAVLPVALGKCPAADGELSRVQISRIGKPATALVEVKVRDGYGYGSAFCIHASGLFVTNQHVAQGGITLVLNAGMKTEKSYSARVIRKDEELDLALLRVEGAKDLPTLTLGSDEKLEELMEVVAFGFPFGKSLAPSRLQYPAISVNPGNITSLRRQGGNLSLIQVDVALNPGNSGGPVLDKSGKVVGVVVAGVVGSGVNFAIPVSAVARFLARPDVQFEPPQLGPANLAEPVLFEARLTPLLPPTAPLTVDLILRPSRGREQVHRMQADGNYYRVTAIPLPPAPASLTLRLRAHFADHVLDAATTADRAFKVGDREVRFGEVRSLRLGIGPRVLLGDGKAIEGAVSGLDAVPVRLGKDLRPVNLSRAAAVEFRQAARSDLLWYTLLVRQGDRELLRQWGNVVIPESLPDLAGGGKSPTSPSGGDKVVYKLPAAIADLAVGGAGHDLILHLPKARQLAIFDVDAGEVVGHIPMNEENARFAAGREEVVVLLPGAGTIERWSLKTLARELSAPLPLKGPIKAVAMGSASEGPLLVHWARGTTAFDRASFALLDLETMRLVEREIPMHGSLGAFHGDVVQLRASANGKVFGLWSTSHTPSGMGTIVASPDGPLWYYAHDSAGYILPSPDGKIIFTRSGMYSLSSWLEFASVGGDGKTRFLRRNARQVSGGQPPGVRALPACRGDYYLTLPQAGKESAAVIRAPGKDRPIATLTDLELPPPGEEGPKDARAATARPSQWPPSMELPKQNLTFDKRVHLLPGARLIITIPVSNDQLVLNRLGSAGRTIPQADEEAAGRIFTYIDLQSKANQKLKEAVGSRGNNLAALPTGEQDFAGVPFSVGPAAIQLGSPSFPDRPAKVEGIPVGRRFARLHFLHATGHGAAEGAVIGNYTVTWDDGTSASIPVRYGKDVLDWWYADDSPEPTEGKVAWQGDNEDARRSGRKIRLYLMTWETPRPDREVKTIAFARVEGTPCAPFCVAMTAEGKD